MPIYLKDLVADPGLLTRALAGKKSRAELREEAEDRMYEALGREIEERPLGRPLGDRTTRLRRTRRGRRPRAG